MQDEIRGRLLRRQIVLVCGLVTGLPNNEADDRRTRGRPVVVALLVCMGLGRSVAASFGRIGGHRRATQWFAAVCRHDARNRVCGSRRCCQFLAVGLRASTTGRSGESHDKRDDQKRSVHSVSEGASVNGTWYRQGRTAPTYTIVSPPLTRTFASSPLLEPEGRNC